MGSPWRRSPSFTRKAKRGKNRVGFSWSLEPELDFGVFEDWIVLVLYTTLAQPLKEFSIASTCSAFGEANVLGEQVPFGSLGGSKAPYLLQ